MNPQVIKRFNIDVIAITLSVFFTLFLFTFGWFVHPIVTFGLEADDDYVGKADLLRQGTIPKDPFRPLFYPILTALFGTIFGNTFVGGKLVSTLMGGLLVFGTYRLGVEVFSRKAAFIALLFMITNPHVILYSMHAATDIQGAALMTWVLVFVARFVTTESKWRQIIWGGVVFALAYFTRYQALFLLPTIFLGLVFRAGRSLKTLCVSIFLFFLSAAIVLLPHFVMTVHTFGTPLYNENWRNLAFKLYGENNHHLFYYLNFDGVFQVIQASPAKFIKEGMAELLSFLQSGNGTLMGVHPLLDGGVLLGLFVLAFRLKKTSVVLLSFWVVFTCGQSFTFFTHPRFMLALLPSCYLIFSYFFLHLPITRFRMILLIVLIGMLCSIKIFAMIPNLKAFIDSHPISEVEALKSLEQEHGNKITVMGRCRKTIIQRYVGITYHELTYTTIWRYLPLEGEITLETYYIALYNALLNTHTDYLLIGRVSIKSTHPSEQHVPENLLDGLHLPHFLKIYRRHKDYILYKVIIPM